MLKSWDILANYADFKRGKMFDFGKTNGIFVPRDETPKKTFSQRYYSVRTNCPKCGGNNIETTCIGYIIHDDGPSKDGNQARCECGWVGIVHDMVISNE